MEREDPRTLVLMPSFPFAQLSFHLIYLLMLNEHLV
jgi:hypothetical protein